VHARVGATRADEIYRLLEDLAERLAKLAHHGADTVVLGEPVERCAVVRNGQPGSPEHRYQRLVRRRDE
jgi:hypothetical protein